MSTTGYIKTKIDSVMPNLEGIIMVLESIKEEFNTRIFTNEVATITQIQIQIESLRQELTRKREEAVKIQEEEQAQAQEDESNNQETN